MTYIYAARSSGFDTPEIVALREQINAASLTHQRVVDEFRKRERADIERYMQLLRELRPTYPNDNHIAGIAAIVELIATETSYGSSHGWPRKADIDAGNTLPEGVAFFSKMARINVYAHAPYKPGTAEMLWEFTPAELAGFTELLNAHGLQIIREWAHADGHAFVVALVTTAHEEHTDHA